MVSPVFGTVETVNISPSVLLVGQPITFSGVDIETISPNNPQNTISMYIYPGFDCSLTPSNSIAFTTTSVSGATGGTYSGTYNTTLSFPVSVATSTQSHSGVWVTDQSYHNGLPAGPYSVAVTDTEAITNGAAGICKNFTVVNSLPVPEFSDPAVAMCSALASLLPFLLVRGRRHTH